MNLTPIARSATTPGWYHLIPTGEYPGILEDAAGKRTRVIQVCDTIALNAIVNRFNLEASQPNFSGILIDQEHFSYNADKSTEAFGWIKELQHRGIDADRTAPGTGIWARIEWTDAGTPAVSTGRYRFISPVWQPGDCETLAGNRLRPLRLDTAGLTNKPNMRGMVPLSNRKTEPATKKPNKPMNQIATKLGLSAEASEEAILAELSKILNRASEADGRLKPLADENASLKNRLESLESEQIDLDLDAHGIREEPVRVKLKPVLAPMKNRADRLEFLKLMNRPVSRAGGGSPPLTNRQLSRTPAISTPSAADPTRAILIKNRAAEIEKSTRCTLAQSFLQAEAQVNQELQNK